ncbi:hypothetical protein RB614_40500 [Phytohabitans sp. ZYX-F-186]|uniref:HTH merR-type domain-containing protein n=1 Tax=Phytohabitans maris TaxID=3071409 RepID=A0ABU0ZVH2_9ACTN|nr:hypothetical protein [Phytohabitans sp. ZYX-F-186]MDQ7910791.1 hypothetical protein [Phytohabitans sp. ZYX-F-186]
MSGEPLYTLREVAAITGFSLNSIELDCREGRVRYTKRGGRERVHKRMTAEQVEELRRFRVKEPEPQPLSDIEAVIAATRAVQRRSPRRSRTGRDS